MTAIESHHELNRGAHENGTAPRSEPIIKTSHTREEHQMATAETVVRTFFDDTAKSGNLIAAMEQHCAQECVWENTGLPTATGLDEMKGFMQHFIDGFGLDALVVEFRAIAANDGRVVTERIDHLDAADGSRIMSLPVAGTLEVQDGKIVAWRDYADPRPFLPGD